MVHEHTAEHASQWAAIRSVGEKLGCSVGVLRRWYARPRATLANGLASRLTRENA
jgi:hypothetical protein